MDKSITRRLRPKKELTPEEIEAKRIARLERMRQYRLNHLDYFNEYQKKYHALHKPDGTGRQKIKNDKQPFSVKELLAKN